METTDYCNYELSKALKAAGFDELCHYHYDCDRGSHIIEPNYTTNDGEDCRYITADDLLEDNNGWQYCSAPTLAHAQKWLREKGIAVSVQANEIQGELWYSADIITTKGVNELVDGGFDYMAYEAALSAGISAALELIKKGE